MVEPANKFIDGWHIEAICEHLEAVTNGQVQNLLINVPPGHMKSLIVSVFWEAWMWTRLPHWRFLNASYAQTLATRDSVRCRALITSEWYQSWFNPNGKWGLTDDQNVKTYFQNTETGFRLATSVGGAATGFRGNTLVVDDPLNALDAHSKTAREQCITWWDESFANRLNSLEDGSRVVIMQRLHENDLSGHLIKSGEWEHLCLPTEFESKRIIVSSIGWQDPRTSDGELLFTGMLPAHIVETEKKRLGSNGYAGQHQQRPAPEAGAIFLREWWHYYKEAPDLREFDEIIQSWDCTFKNTDGSDYVVGQVWGRRGAQKWLLDQVRGRMSFTETKKSIKNLSAKWPLARTILIEDKANGPAIIDDLKKDVAGLIPVEPDGSKEARAHAVTPTVEAGNVFIPDPTIAPWVNDFVEEYATFPNGANDDQVDAGTQALNRLNNRVNHGYAVGGQRTFNKGGKYGG